MITISLKVTPLLSWWLPPALSVSSSSSLEWLSPLLGHKILSQIAGVSWSLTCLSPYNTTVNTKGYSPPLLLQFFPLQALLNRKNVFTWCNAQWPACRALLCECRSAPFLCQTLAWLWWQRGGGIFQKMGKYSGAELVAAHEMIFKCCVLCIFKQQNRWISHHSAADSQITGLFNISE